MTRRDQTLPDLSGLVAVVTGGAGGIGTGIVRRLSAAGADVVIHYRSNATAAAALAEDLVTAGSRATACQADITDPAQCASLIGTAVDAFGHLDIVVNNAGAQPVQPLASMTVSDWRAVVDANLTGTFNVTQAAVDALRRRPAPAATDTAPSAAGRNEPTASTEPTAPAAPAASAEPTAYAAPAEPTGCIIHIASIEATHPARNHAHYSASKAAIVMHARAAALEYGPLGIRVNAISPGLIDRDGLAATWPDGVDRYRRAAPLGRLGTADEIGNACVFLASPLAAWITGHNLVVDGGVSTAPTW